VSTAMITGITGQDGSYLAELLLSKGYTVVGVKRRHSSLEAASRVDHVYDNAALHLRYGDVCDGAAMARLLHEYEPDEVYNLAAQSHVGVSFEVPEYTADSTAIGALRLLEAIRTMRRHPRFYQASSSEMFGNAASPQSEDTPLRPRSPYACAKVFAHNVTVNYREAYGLHASCGILFNHESPRRGETFVTRKVARAAARIAAGLQDGLVLGNLTARRDWGHARDYVYAMWLMLQQDDPGDYVIATGESHSVGDLCRIAFELAGEPMEGRVTVSDRYRRPTEVDDLRGDYSRARTGLGWEPLTSFRDLIEEMVRSEMAAAQ